MRTFIVCLGLCAVLGTPDALSAQSYGRKGAQARSGQRPRREASRSRELIHQRAALRARQRTARIELRKALGISLTRPTYGARQYRDEEFPYAFHAGWGGLMPRMRGTAKR